MLSARVKNLAPSPTLAIAQKAKQLQAAGHKVLNLGAGEPDFDTPQHIKDAGIKAIQSGDTKYTDVGGTAALKDAIIAKFLCENNLQYTREQIVVGVGAKHVLFNALIASVDAGDEVIIPAPYWVSYPEMVAIAGGTPILLPCPESQGFKLQPAQLAASITPKTKWLILNSPSNPTGAIYSQAELQALADVLRAHPHVYVMVDDMYEHLRYDGADFCSFAQAAPDLFDRTLTVNGVSKAYAMTGWRIGYAGGPAVLIKAMTTMQGQSTTNACSIAQAAAVEALNGSQQCVADMRAIYQKRRDLLVAGINAQSNGLRVAAPAGAFYLYVDCTGWLGKTTAKGAKLSTEADVVDYLLQEHLVAAVPGAAFGLSPYFRIYFAIADDVVGQVIERLEAAGAGLG